MMHGIIKENGKVTGYKTPIHSILSTEEIKYSKDKQQDELKRADLALGEWAQWCISKHGHNRISSIMNIDETPTGFDSRLPNGVDCTPEVGNVIYVFEVMRKSNNHGCFLLSEFYLKRQKKESVMAFFKRLFEEKQKFAFDKAKKEFANRLSMLA